METPFCDFWYNIFPERRLCEDASFPGSGAGVRMHLQDTPGLHNKIPANKIFARVWVAQEPILPEVVAKIFQGLGPKRQKSCDGDRPGVPFLAEPCYQLSFRKDGKKTRNISKCS